MDCIQGEKGFVSAAGVCFMQAYPSSKPKSSTTLSLNQSALPWPEALLRLACASHEHTRHPNPKLPQLKQPSTAVMFHRFSEETCSIIFLFKRDTKLAQFHFNPINFGYVATPKIKSPTYTIYMTSGPTRIHGSNLDCFKLQASSFSVIQNALGLWRSP